MIFDLRNPKHRKILLILAISAIAYSISSVMAYIVAVNIPISIALISTRVGFLIATLCFLAIERNKIDLGFSKSGIVSWIYGISFAAVGLLLFISYQHQSLSNIFPLVEGGVLVFLALDLAFHRKKLGSKTILLLTLGVVVVFLGTFFAESSGFSLNLSTLPYAIGIILATGIGYYAMANKTKTVTESSKQLAFVISGLVVAILVLSIYHGPNVLSKYNNLFFLAGVVAGALLCVALSMEIKAVKHAMTGNERKNVILRNFINNFTELDTVIVLLASVAIGSYTIDGLLGGALIVIGVLILSVMM